MTRIFSLATPAALLTALLLLPPGAVRAADQAEQGMDGTEAAEEAVDPDAAAAAEEEPDSPDPEAAAAAEQGADETEATVDPAGAEATAKAADSAAAQPGAEEAEDAAAAGETPTGNPLLAAALVEVDDQVAACLHQVGTHGASRRLKLDWRVRPDGRFEAVKVAESTLESPEAEACVVEVVRGVTLPPQPQAMPVSWVWVYDPAASEPLITFQGDSRRWSGSVSLGTSTGMTLFHPNAYVRSADTAVMTRAGVGGSWRLDDARTLGLDWGFAYELTLPNNPSGRRFFPGDPSLGLGLGELWSDDFTGISVGGSLSASVGLSPTARWATRLGTVGGGLSASRRFQEGRFVASASLGATGYLHRYRSPVGDPVADDGVEMLLARRSGPEALGNLVAVVGNNPVASANVGFGASWRISDRTSATINLGFGRTWVYAPEVDALSPTLTDANGEPVVECGGICPMDSMSGSLGLSWQAFDAWNLGANLGTGGAVFGYRRVDPQDPDPAELDQDARVLRFPFWDPNLQATSFSVSMSRGF